ITGYKNEEFTHMSVAVSVLSGAADAGLGILAAAKALDLDFIPVVTEQYDLIIPEEFFKTQLIQTLINTINTDNFKTRVQALGGYSTKKTGQITGRLSYSRLIAAVCPPGHRQYARHQVSRPVTG
ncbi:MAG: hypothetical protein GY869_26785, partial [Planctomycetes bacterium]|nr:hypothetical protein [Planctomycetota bacterium]